MWARLTAPVMDLNLQAGTWWPDCGVPFSSIALLRLLDQIEIMLPPVLRGKPYPLCYLSYCILLGCKARLFRSKIIDHVRITPQRNVKCPLVVLAMLQLRLLNLFCRIVSNHIGGGVCLAALRDVVFLLGIILVEETYSGDWLLARL